MNTKALIIGILFMLPAVGYSHHISGKVLDAKSKKAIEFATVWIEGTGIGTITDANGHFLLPNLPEGSYDLVVRCLGYTESKKNVALTSNTEVIIYLSELSLALDEVTITAEKSVQEATTTYTLNQTALNHLQSVCVTDALSLLPGGQTSKYKTLTSGQVVTLRGETQEMGNPDFGTVVEMDGVRLSSNASALSTEGTDLRNVGYHHIEKIDVITGVPSVEYGDLTNGVIKIVTKKEKSPLQADIAVRPHTQSYALNKGIDLGGKRGVVNLSYERARSVSDLASPFTSYTRNALALKYSNTFHYASDRSLLMDLSLNGNLGGLDSESDPDAFKETYTKKRDYALWSSLSFQYLIHSAWLSNLQWGLAFAYSDKQSEVKANKSSSSALPALHTTEEGYFVASKYEENPSSPILLLPTGYWYVTTNTDNRPISYSAFAKAKWTHKWGAVTSNMLLGSDIKSEGNLGRGEYYNDLSVAPDWRAYRYDKLPYMTNWALYAEEDLNIRFQHSSLNLRGGVRNDMTLIQGSEYGTVSAVSPRISAKFSFGQSSSGLFRGASLRMGWGKAVKLPSFEILYPRTTYVDRLAFAPGTMADGTSYYAYHTHPVAPTYNASLQWQYNIMREVGADIRLKGVSLSFSFYYNSMKKPYTTTRSYSPFDYKLTLQSDLESCPIPSVDRMYTIDRHTGIVTVTDKMSAYPSQELAYKVVKDFQSSTMSTNGTSSSRMGFEWIVDFDKIRSIQTSIRFDGKYYQYRGVDEVIVPSRVNLTTSDGQPYKYIGYYVGGTGNYNGFESRRLNTNLTFITHIPKLRMIFSLRVEGTLLNTRQNLSEYSGGTRSYATDERGDYLPSATDNNIYDGNNFVVTYPLYYVSREDMDTQIPYLDKLLWAYDNDKELYNELTKLAVKSSYGYIFNKQRYAPYFSANINVTKEIGKYLSISFFAHNFFYSMQKIKNEQTGNELSLFDSSLIAPFNYGISFKLKL